MYVYYSPLIVAFFERMKNPKPLMDAKLNSGTRFTKDVVQHLSRFVLVCLQSVKDTNMTTTFLANVQ
jgi:hypothetical protein